MASILRLVGNKYSILGNKCLGIVYLLLSYFFSALTWKPKIPKSRVIQVTRWYPIITTGLIMISLIFKLIGFPYSMFISTLFGCAAFGAICWLIPSWHYGFCFWHQLLILNLFIISGTSFIKLFGVFEDINAVRIKLITNIISIALAWVLYLLSEKIVQWKVIITKKLNCHGK